MELLHQTMTKETFAKINQPLYVGYYYKTEEESDHVVSVPAMRNFVQQISTPADKLRFQAFPDVGSHVMISSLQSGDIPGVQRDLFDFAEKVLEMQPKQ